jgi:hypothetical protein
MENSDFITTLSDTVMERFCLISGNAPSFLRHHSNPEFKHVNPVLVASVSTITGSPGPLSALAPMILGALRACVIFLPRVADLRLVGNSFLAVCIFLTFMYSHPFFSHFSLPVEFVCEPRETESLPLVQARNFDGPFAGCMR